MTENESKLVRMLSKVTHALQLHIAEDARRQHCTPSDYCPCTDGEIAEAIALLADYGTIPTH